MQSIKKYAAEFIGTLVLVFMGCGSAVLLGADMWGSHLAVALAFGLSLTAMAYAIGGVSGCHINPAVSLAMLINKKIGAADFAGYAAAQITGALAGAGLLKYISAAEGIDMTGTLGSNEPGEAGIIGALVIEIVLTFIFVLTVLGVSSDKSKGASAGIVAGAALTLVHIVGIPLTGTSVNPARSIGPALLSGDSFVMGSLWIFITAPLIGAAIAAAVFRLLSSDGQKTPKAQYTVRDR